MGQLYLGMSTYRIFLIITVCFIHSSTGLTANPGLSANIERHEISSLGSAEKTDHLKRNKRSPQEKTRKPKKDRKIGIRRKINKAKHTKQRIRKIKLDTKRNKKVKNKRNQKLIDPRQSCSGNTPVSSSCLENAALVLIYEKNQVTNYLKQSKQLIRHKNMTDNKLIKKGEFKNSANHMLMAIGGNLSNPICGENSTDSNVRRKNQRALDLHLDYYSKLNNCSEAIHEACDVPDDLHNETSLEKIKECNTTKEDFRILTKTCQTDKMKNNATMQCDCWAEARLKMKELQELECETNKAKKEVTANKRKCNKVFSNCKKMEDFSVFLIYTCMNDHSLHLINQTAESLHNGAMEDASKELDGADKAAKQVLDGDDHDMEKHFDHDPYNDHDRQ